MNFERVAGILLHPTSLPGPYGIGDLGYEAFNFIDFLAEAGQKIWQVFPLGPTGYGDSPYQCFSAFAGNPFLISPDILVEKKLLEPDDLRDIPPHEIHHIDFGEVIKFKTGLLELAFDNFKSKGKNIEDICGDFCNENKYWLDDYALFMACKKYFGGKIWADWDEDIAFRKADAVNQWSSKLNNEVEYQKFIQFMFYSQWHSLKNYANTKGIKIIGDMPIYVAYDSSDVWANPHLFSVDQNGKLDSVAGVPPDYFSPTGQLWGNPLYKWEVMKEDNFDWWIKRFEQLYKTIDIVRIDHFRGFEAYYKIPGDAETAINGDWIKAPGDELFEAIKTKLGDVPILAEDLGIITKEVVELREKFGFPGMKILQFAFGENGEKKFLPHNHTPNSVVYTGSHDNETTRGFFEREKKEKSGVMEAACEYLYYSGDQITNALIKSAYASVANIIVIPMQDILNLDNNARMNFPGKPYGNWTWRYSANQLTSSQTDHLKKLAVMYERIPELKKNEFEQNL